MYAAALSAIPLLAQVGSGIVSTVVHDLGGLFHLGQARSQGQNVPAGAEAGPASSTAPSLASAASALSGDLMGVLIGLQSAASTLGDLNPASAATALIQSGDTNSDGALSQAEFEQGFSGLQSLLGHHPTGDGSNAQADKVFARLDINGDGQVSQTELANYLTAAQQAAVLKYQKADQLVAGFATQFAAILNGPTVATAPTTTPASTPVTG